MAAARSPYLTRWRRQAIGGALVLFAIAGILGTFGTEELLQLVRGFTQHRPVIASGLLTVSSLLLVPMTVLLGLILLLGQQATPERMKHPPRRSTIWGGRFVVFMLVSLGAALVAPAIQYLVVAHLATGRGYVACPHISWPRKQPARWAVSPDRCPGEGADPNG